MGYFEGKVEVSSLLGKYQLTQHTHTNAAVCTRLAPSTAANITLPNTPRPLPSLWDHRPIDDVIDDVT